MPSRLQSIREKVNSSVYITLNNSLERKIKKVVSPKDSRINPLNLTFDLRRDVVKGSSSNLREKSGKRPTETVEVVEESKQANSNELTIPEHSHDQTQGSIDESGAEHEQSTPSRVEHTKVEPMKNELESNMVKENKHKLVIDKKKIKKKVKPIHKLCTIHQADNPDESIMDMQPKRAGTTQLKDEDEEKALNEKMNNEKPRARQKTLIKHQNTIFNTEEMIVSQYLNEEISVRKGQSSSNLSKFTSTTRIKFESEKEIRLSRKELDSSTSPKDSIATNSLTFNVKPESVARHIKEEQSTKTIEKNLDMEPVMFGMKESKTFADAYKLSENASESEHSPAKIRKCFTATFNEAPEVKKVQSSCKQSEVLGAEPAIGLSTTKHMFVSARNLESMESFGTPGGAPRVDHRSEENQFTLYPHEANVKSDISQQENEIKQQEVIQENQEDSIQDSKFEDGKEENDKIQNSSLSEDYEEILKDVEEVESPDIKLEGINDKYMSTRRLDQMENKNESRLSLIKPTIKINPAEQIEEEKITSSVQQTLPKASEYDTGEKLSIEMSERRDSNLNVTNADNLRRRISTEVKLNMTGEGFYKPKKIVEESQFIPKSREIDSQRENALKMQYSLESVSKLNEEEKDNSVSSDEGGVVKSIRSEMPKSIIGIKTGNLILQKRDTGGHADVGLDIDRNKQVIIDHSLTLESKDSRLEPVPANTINYLSSKVPVSRQSLVSFNFGSTKHIMKDSDKYSNLPSFNGEAYFVNQEELSNFGAGQSLNFDIATDSPSMKRIGGHFADQLEGQEHLSDSSQRMNKDLKKKQKKEERKRKDNNYTNFDIFRQPTSTMREQARSIRENLDMP